MCQGENDEIQDEYKLIDVELITILESIDISSLTEKNKSEFPSEEFGNFMKLITKWNLSDACSSDILRFT